MLLHATHTHLYPGLEGEISGISGLAGLETGCECLVEFVDGSATCAKISRATDGWQLQTNAYRTRAGTDIAAKRWRVRFDEAGKRIGFRILRRDHD